ncbi:MAG: glycosyltransferase [Bryobacteraceae bacterium]|nr:glycosyltransferase [Bryobacteraceae bacterium]
MANEGSRGADFAAAVLEHCGGIANVRFFAVLDRATRDNSLELMRELEAREPRLTVVWAPENRCVVDAYVCGYRHALEAGFDWILEIDAGFSHQPEDIAQFLEAMREGRDCVFGSRFMKGGAIVNSPLSRRLVSRGGTILANLLLGTRQTDMTSGFEMFTHETLRMVLDRGIQSRAHFFQTEIKAYCRNLNYVEMPIRYEAASPGLSGPALADSFKHLWRLARMRMKGEL